MIDLQPLLAFAGTALVLTMAPGLDTATVLRTSAAESTRHGMLAALGIGIGCLLWGTAVALGLGALLAASELAFTLLKWTGAVYLLWLGMRLLLSPAKTPAAMEADSAPARSGLAALRRGFATNMLNPKVGMFYMTLLPQFIPTGTPGPGYALLLACIHVVLALVWFTILAAGTSLARKLLRRPSVARGVDFVTGCVFVGFGASLVRAAH